MRSSDFPHTEQVERPSAKAHSQTEEPAPARPERPSLRQIMAGAMAAVSSTALLSLLGLWGTILGMGLLSVLTVLGTYMYSSFIQRASEKVKHTLPVGPHATQHPSAPPHAGIQGQAHPLDTDRSVSHQFDTEEFSAEESSAGKFSTERSAAPRQHSAPGPAANEENGRRSHGLRAAWDSMIKRYGPKRIVVSIVIVFVLLAGTITAIELAVGKPLSDIVRNETGSGTSFTRVTDSEGSRSDNTVEYQDDSGEPAQEQQEDSPEEQQAPEEQEQQEELPEEQAPEEAPPEQQAPLNEQQPAPEEGDTE